MGSCGGAGVLAFHSRKIAPEHGLLAWLSTSFVGLVAAKIFLFVAMTQFSIDLSEIGWCVAAVAGYLGNNLLLAADGEGEKLAKNPIKYVTNHLAGWLESAASAIKPSKNDE